MSFEPISDLKIDLAEGEGLKRAHFSNLEAIFNLLPGILFYVKDRSGRWVTCNNASLRLLRRSCQEEVVGAREEDFFPKTVAASIRQDDLLVLRSATAIVNRIEIIANEHGQLIWVKTSKLPVRTAKDRTCGLVGVTSQIDQTVPLPEVFERFRKVIQHIEEHQSGVMRMADLAGMAGLSESHFRRSFKTQFGISPQEFILRQRLRTAARMLTETDQHLSAIALECGFGDQSYFSRQFARFFGDPPRKYRLRWRN